MKLEIQYQEYPLDYWFKKILTLEEVEDLIDWHSDCSNNGIITQGNLIKLERQFLGKS